MTASLLGNFSVSYVEKARTAARLRRFLEMISPTASSVPASRECSVEIFHLSLAVSRSILDLFMKKVAHTYEGDLLLIHTKPEVNFRFWRSK
jgi:hypothetical protein